MFILILILVIAVVLFRVFFVMPDIILGIIGGLIMLWLVIKHSYPPSSHH